MKLALAVAAAVLVFAACRKGPKYEEPKQSEAAPAETPAAAAAPAPAQEPVRANPTYGADLIRKAQGAAASANGQVRQEQTTDVPQQ
jgi:hypothetical protein